MADVASKTGRIKYEVVMKDERESGLREILNLWHTVGRAIETVSDYKLLHGEALSIGLVAEVKLAYKLGYMTEAQCGNVVAFDEGVYATKIEESVAREIIGLVPYGLA